MLKISKLHYISQGGTPGEHLRAMLEVGTGGGSWMQLRLKDVPETIVLEAARQAKRICDKLKVTLIINDHVKVAQKVMGSGVHLGQNDLPPKEARDILGPDFIIGGTANSIKDIERLAAAGVDYIGLGPYRFTMTKKRLKPILGLEGYRHVVDHCRKNNIHIPIIAIGGIRETDLGALLDIGVHGVALSHFLTQAADKQKSIAIMNHVIKEKTKKSTL